MSLSPSLSVSLSPSLSPSLSESPSPSLSESRSPSVSVSLSESRSSSASQSPSSSESLSVSLSPSASPSVGYKEYTRGNYAELPADDTDLETDYTAQDVLDVADKDDTRVSQGAIDQYAIHQFKDFTSTGETATLEWEGQTNYPPSISTVYLEIFNRDTEEWEIVDSDNTSAADTDFILTADILDLNNYKDGNSVISCRVYQLAT